VSEKRRFILAHPLARQRAQQAVGDAPAGYIVTVQEPTRTGDQNAALHARLTEIADRCEWIGKRWPMEVWKRLLTAAWCRATGEAITMLPALDGQGVDIVFRRTSSLSRRECSDLLEFINAWAAEQPAMQEEAA
jgi:hypothetical protein